MGKLTEGRYAAEFVLWEQGPTYSRGNITIASGAGVIAPGTVLGKVTASGKYVVSAIGASDGSEDAVCINLYPVDATSEDVEVAAIVRAAEVNANILTYHSDRDQQAEKDAANAQLEALGIVVKS